MNSNISTDSIDSDAEKKLKKSTTSYIKIHVLGEDKAMFFNATVSGINETVSPEIQDYKFLGSPFKVYTYSGVERNLTFDFKLYYYDRTSKESMVEKLEYLTKLAYPFEQLVQTKYPNSNTADSGQIMFAPNFIKLSIKSLYTDIFGIVDTLSFSVDDNTTWATSVSDDDNMSMLPSVINVQFGMKIIESANNYNIVDKADKKIFRYNFRNIEEQTKINQNLDSNQGKVTVYSNRQGLK